MSITEKATLRVESGKLVVEVPSLGVVHTFASLFAFDHARLRAAIIRNWAHAAYHRGQSRREAPFAPMQLRGRR